MADVILTEELTKEEFNLLLNTLQYGERHSVTATEATRIRKLTDKMVAISHTVDHNSENAEKSHETS